METLSTNTIQVVLVASLVALLIAVVVGMASCHAFMY